MKCDVPEQNLTEKLALERPEAPIDFLLNEMEMLQEQENRRKGIIKQKPSSDSKLSN